MRPSLIGMDAFNTSFSLLTYVYRDKYFLLQYLKSMLHADIKLLGKKKAWRLDKNLAIEFCESTS